MDKKEIKTRRDECNVCIAKLREEEKRLKKELEAEEVTYSIGDRFKTKNYNNKKHILMSVWNDEVIMGQLGNGRAHCCPVKVRNLYAITQEELGQICSCDPVRYWDSQKEVLS